jgi:hypothetical protein
MGAIARTSANKQLTMCFKGLVQTVKQQNLPYDRRHAAVHVSISVQRTNMPKKVATSSITKTRHAVRNSSIVKCDGLHHQSASGKGRAWIAPACNTTSWLNIDCEKRVCYSAVGMYQNSNTVPICGNIYAVPQLKETKHCVRRGMQHVM